MITRAALAFAALLFSAAAAALASFDPAAHSILQTDRPDGRYLSTRGFEQQTLRDLKPRLRFNPAFTADQMATWRLAVRSKMRELMNFPDVASRPPPRLLRTDRRAGYRLEKWEIYPEPGGVVTFLALVPDSASSKNRTPAVLCFPGSRRSKEELAGEPELQSRYGPMHWPEKAAQALQYVKAGLVAVAVDNPGTAEQSDLEGYSQISSEQRRLHGQPFDFDGIARIMIELGRSYLSLSAYQSLQVLDWLRQRDYVDGRRIALSGHSLGTEPLMVIGVLEPDIAAFVFNDFVCRTQERATVMTKPTPEGFRLPPNGIFQTIPGMWRWFDYPDLLAALAPRPLLITEGGVTRELRMIGDAYRIAGAADCLSVHYYPKYADPRSRRDPETFPEGLGSQEYMELANVDSPNHYFKGYLAVPWLTRALAVPNRSIP
jgi:hypothetical protein